MSKTLDRIRSMPHVAHVDDERGIDNAIIVTLAAGCCFVDDEGCGVKGFDNVNEALTGCAAKRVSISKRPSTTNKGKA